MRPDACNLICCPYLEPMDHIELETHRIKGSFASAIWTAFAAVAVLWWIKLIEVMLDTSFVVLGVTPREPFGLIGVITAPLLHGSFEHLIANSVPLLILGALGWYGYRKSMLRALPLIWLGSGLLVWLFARESHHIGASGVVQGLVIFLIVLGFLRKERPALGIGMIALFLYGGTIWGVLPQTDQSISWESHLAGALMGLFAGLYWRNLDPAWPRKKYSWELEEELEALRLESEQNEYEIPRPHDVPILWKRDAVQAEEPKVLEFPTHRVRRFRAEFDDEPPTDTKH